MGVTSDWRRAEERIRAAYARRARSAGLYSWSDPAHVFGMQEREWAILLRLTRAEVLPLEGKRILEVGCGSGAWLRDLCRWGADPERVFGIELQAAPIDIARRRCPPGVTIEQASAADLPFPDASFDIVLQATVFTSILNDALKQRVAGEMQRVLRPDGVIVWYDFFVDNPSNRDVKGVKRAEIRRLFSSCDVTLWRTGLAPPLRRALAKRSWMATWVLSRVPWLSTYYVGVIRKAQR